MCACFCETSLVDALKSREDSLSRANSSLTKKNPTCKYTDVKHGPHLKGFMRMLHAHFWTPHKPIYASWCSATTVKTYKDVQL